MSTTQLMFNDRDVEIMVAELKEWPNSFWDDGNKELGVSPFTTFYFLYDTKDWIATSLKMIEIHEAFEKITGFPYRVATHPVSERPYPYGSKRIPNLREFASQTKKSDSFLFNVSSEENHHSSPAHAGYFWKKRDYMNDREEPGDKRFSHIQLYYRWQWFLDNKEVWREFVLETISKLNAEVVYSGLAMANPLEYGTRSEITVWERALAPHFFGLDIDDPQSMSYVGNGIRPPTWGFLLSDNNRVKLELTREQVLDRLSHPEINIVEVKNGFWIELGSAPSLLPVEKGCPKLQSILNTLLRPIRNDNMDLLGFAQWEDDPNQRFNPIDSVRWMRRFDTDSDWPAAELRHPPQQEQSDLQPGKSAGELRVKAGDPCPKSGQWQAMDLTEEVRRYMAGELLENLGSTYGITVWRYVGP